LPPLAKQQSETNAARPKKKATCSSLRFSKKLHHLFCICSHRLVVSQQPRTVCCTAIAGYFSQTKNHLVKENPYLQNSSSVPSPSIQYHTTQQLSLISLKLFSISRRKKKKKKTENYTQRHTQANVRKLENFWSGHSKFTNANTLPEEYNRKQDTNKRQERRRTTTTT
jgi:hypothetical protein